MVQNATFSREGLWEKATQGPAKQIGVQLARVSKYAGLDFRGGALHLLKSQLAFG